MKNIFYSQFDIQANNLISVSGADDNDALIHVLAEEAISAGYRSLVLSNVKQKYPIEGKVLVSDETHLLMELIRSDEPIVTYLARGVNGDLLLPFTNKEIKSLLKQMDQDIKLFVHKSALGKPNQEINRLFKKGLHICTLNFNTLRPELFDVYKSTAIRSSATTQKKVLDRFLQMITHYCPSFSTEEENPKLVLFIGQIKNMLDENLVIPVIRSLKEKLPAKILYGHLNHYQLKEI